MITQYTKCPKYCRSIFLTFPWPQWEEIASEFQFIALWLIYEKNMTYYFDLNFLYYDKENSIWELRLGGSMHFSNFCRDFPKWFKEHRSISEQNNFFYTHCISICKNLGQKSSICDPSKNTKIGKRAYVRVVIHTKPFCID